MKIKNLAGIVLCLLAAAALPAFAEVSYESELESPEISASLDASLRGMSSELSLFKGPAAPAAASKTVLSLPLAPIFDTYLSQTPLSFRTKAGKVIKIGATRAVNCSNGSDDCSGTDNFFILFMDGSKVIPVHAYSMVNVPVVKAGSAKIKFDGDSEVYVAKLKLKSLKITDPSEVELTIKAGGQTLFTARASALLSSMFAKAPKFSLNGASYAVFYGRDLMQNKSHQAVFSPTSRSVLLFPVTNMDLPYYELNYAQFSRQAFAFPSAKNLVFAIRNDSLIIRRN